MKQCVITGIGPISHIGIEKEDFQNNLILGNTNFTEINRFKLGENDKIRKSGQIKGLKFSTNNKSMNTTLQKIENISKNSYRQYIHGLVSAKMAYKDAKLVDVETPISLITGSSGLEGNILFSESMNFHRSALGLPNTLNSLIAKHLKLSSEIISVNSACLTGISALKQAYNMIQCGDSEIVLVGTSDCPIQSQNYGNINERLKGTKALSKSGINIPFDESRDGPILSEAASFLVVESLESAIKREVNIYCSIDSIGIVTEVNDNPTDISPLGYMKAISKTLKNHPKKIDYINAHGTGTLKNDKAEAEAISQILGDKIPVSSFKGTLGHSLTSSNLTEIIGTILCMQKNRIPKTNLKKIDSNLPNLNYVKGEKEIELDTILKLGAGFGGQYGGVLLSKYKK